MRLKNSEAVRAEFYVKRDANILKETGFDLKDEQVYQNKCHHKYESNNSKCHNLIANNSFWLF